MNNKFKSYARSYWSDNFLWYVVKFKNYTEREILKNCHLLKLLREYLSKTYNSKLRRKYLDFCDLKENIESFEYIESGKLEFFMSCEALNNNLTVIQEGGGSATERQSMLDKFNNGYSYSKLIEKYEKKKLDDLGANFRNFINWFDDWGYAVRKNIGKKKFLYITEIGNDAADNYNNPAVALSIFRDQIKKYQFPNTSKKQLSLFKKESIKPYYAIVQIALDLPKNYFTKNEYIIFINKTKNHKIESIKKTVEWIKDYRKLSLRDRNKFISYLKFIKI